MRLKQQNGKLHNKHSESCDFFAAKEGRTDGKIGWSSSKLVNLDHLLGVGLNMNSDSRELNDIRPGGVLLKQAGREHVCLSHTRA